jgi:cytochrome c biogenesis protein CcmG/thiol:disulfide interchange protein DsbE
MAAPVDPATADQGLDADEPTGGGHLARNAAIVVGIVVIALIALLATGKTNDQRQPSAKIVGQIVPAVSGTTLTGAPYDIDLHQGKWVVVNFFASWCTPCRIEQPELVKFAAAHQAAGDVEIVSVAFQDKDADVASFFATSGGDWPVLVGDTGSIALSFGVTAVPESYVISPTGQVVAKFEGVTAGALDSVITSLSAPPAAAAPAATP